MGIVLLSKRVRVNLEHVLGVVLVESAELIFVALRQRLGDLLHRFIRQYKAQCLIFQPLAPSVIQFSRIRSPRHDRVIDNKVFVDLVIEPHQSCRQRLYDLFKTLAQLVVIPIKYRESGVKIAPSADIVELESPPAELANIVRVKKHPLWVESVKVSDEMLS